MTIRTTIRLGLLVPVVVCLVCTDTSAQVQPYPYLSVPSRERTLRRYLDDGMVRRAARDLSQLSRDARHSAMADVVPFDRADMFRSSGNRAASDRVMDEFLRARPTSPFAPVAWMERALAAIEAEDRSTASELFARCADEAMASYDRRRDTFYVRLAHTARFWEGASRASLGQFAEAIAAFAACASADSVGTYAAWSWYARGQIYERNGDLPAAVSSYDVVRTRYAGSDVEVASRIRQAVVFLTMRRPERALDVLSGIDARLVPTPEAAPAVDADHAVEEVALIRAESATLRGRYAEAYDSCLVFLERYPTSPYRWNVHLHAGFDALNIQRPDDALRHFTIITDSVTDDASPLRQQAQLYAALCLKQQGKREEADRAFAGLAAQTGYPYQAHALIETGQNAYESGEYDKARRALERAERLSPDARTTVRALIVLGAVLVEQQQWQKAGQIYDRAQHIAEEAGEDILPNREAYLAEARIKRGICLVQGGQTQQAIVALTDFLGNHPTDDRRDEATFWLAEAMYRADLLKNATELYEEIVKRFTASRRREEAMYGLAWTYFRRRDFDRSTAMFGELVRTFPSSRYAAEAMARRGDGLYIARQFNAAADQYEAAARTAPQTEEGQYAAFQAGQASYRAGDMESAVRSMKRFVTSYPKSRLADDAMYLIGWISFQSRNEAQAVEEFRRLLATYPDGDQAVRALYTIGDAQYNLGEIDAALATYRSVIARYPSHPLASEAAKSMQIALLGMGRTEEAIGIADTLINANPHSLAAEEFTLKKAEIFYSGRNYPNAAAELEAYMKKYPSSERQDEALYLLGRTYLTMNELTQARAAFADLERRFTSSSFIVPSKLDLAEYFSQKANSEAADSLYEIVWTRFEKDTDAAAKAGYERALIARQRGDTLRSIELFRMTADRYVGAEYADQARYQVAGMYRRRGDVDSAIYHLQLLTVRTDKPQFASNAWYDLGTIYLRQKRFDEAVAAYDRVRQEYAGYEDWYTLSLLALGECYESLKKFDDANIVYETIVRLRPDDDYGKTAEARIKRLKKVRR